MLCRCSPYMQIPSRRDPECSREETDVGHGVGADVLGRHIVPVAKGIPEIVRVVPVPVILEVSEIGTGADGVGAALDDIGAGDPVGTCLPCQDRWPDGASESDPPSSSPTPGAPR